MAFIDRVMNGFFVIKGLGLYLRPGVWLGFLKNPSQFFANYLSLTKWISQNNNRNVMNDFLVPTRVRGVRNEYYKYIVDKYNLQNNAVTYLEFGVYKGDSMRWWIDVNKNTASFFGGFDTFEGLPESWGPYAKGAMKADMPDIKDERLLFVKGLFQDTLYKFMEQNKSRLQQKLIINLDADLFSATIFVLSTLAPFLKKDDIIMFDEFNVPNHEYYAFKIFTESFPIKLEMCVSRLNLYHMSFKCL